MPDIFTYFRPYDARNYRRTQSSQKTPNKNTSKQGDGSTNENVNSLQNFGIRPRTNTGLTFNLFRPASLNGTYPDLDNVGVHPRTDTGLTLNLFRPAPLQGTYPDLDNFGIHPNNKIGLSLDKYRQTGDDVEYESQTPAPSSQKTTVSNTNNSNTSKPIVQTKKGDTVASIWTRVTGLPWKAAKELGLSDGSYAANIEILKGLKSGQITKESIAALQEAQTATPYEPAPEPKSIPAQPTIERPTLPISESTDTTSPSEREMQMAAYGGWFY